MLITKREAIIRHKNKWNWIADETLKRGRKVEIKEYFDTFYGPFDRIPHNNSYCCDYAYWKANNNESICNVCPIEWKGETCPRPNSLRRKYRDCASYDYLLAAQIAKEIAELPEREF